VPALELYRFRIAPESVAVTYRAVKRGFTSIARAASVIYPSVHRRSYIREPNIREPI